MADVDSTTVAERLRNNATRDAALDALERHAAPIPTAAALAAAPALLNVMSMDAAEVERGAYDRAGLLLARLEAEALPDVVAVHGAAFGNGGTKRLWNSDSVLNVALRQPAAELTRADAASYACSSAFEAIYSARGCTLPLAAAGFTMPKYFGLWMSAEPISSKKKLPDDDVPMKMMTLLLELLKSNELPELAISGAWCGIHYCLTGRPSVASAALACGMFELSVAHLHAIGSPADWIGITRGKAGRAYGLLALFSDVSRSCVGQESRPDQAACVSSGLFDLCIEAIAAFGADGLRDTHTGVFYFALSTVRNNRAHPGCEVKIRSVAESLGFCLLNDLEYIQSFGMTTGSTTASICKALIPKLDLALATSSQQIAWVLTSFVCRAGCGVFGRDEGGSEFVFTSQHVELL